MDTSTGWAVGVAAAWEPAAFLTSNGGATWTPKEVPAGYPVEAVYFVSTTSGWIAAGSSFTDEVNRGEILTTTES